MALPLDIWNRIVLVLTVFAGCGVLTLLRNAWIKHARQGWPLGPWLRGLLMGAVFFGVVMGLPLYLWTRAIPHPAWSALVGKIAVLLGPGFPLCLDFFLTLNHFVRGIGKRATTYSHRPRMISTLGFVGLVLTIFLLTLYLSVRKYAAG